MFLEYMLIIKLLHLCNFKKLFSNFVFQNTKNFRL